MNDTPLPPPRGVPSVRSKLLTWAAILYPVVWIVGLAIGAPSVGNDRSQQETWDAIHGSAATGWQVLLIHGVAGILLLLIAALVGANRRRRGAPLASIRWIVAAGFVAGAISLVQWAIETSLVFGILGSAADNAHSRWQFVAVIDGVKMAALAGFVLALAFAGSRPGRWERGVAFAAAIALIVSGIGYAFLIAPLMLTAALSLPLLLLSVPISSIAEVRRVPHG